MIKYIDHATMVSKKKQQQTFIVANTDISSKVGTH